MRSKRVCGMSAPATERLRGWGHVRRGAFFVWAAILSLLFGITFVGVTVLAIGLWLVNQNPLTNPVSDLGFFALGAVIIASGFVVQLRRPERKIAGVQQAVIGLLALGVAGLILAGGRGISRPVYCACRRNCGRGLWSRCWSGSPAHG